MLCSLTKKFIFIANLKTASSSIEKVLAPFAQLRLQQSQHGKHLPYADFAEHFKWLLNRVDMNQMFVFGVIREPVDYILSIFNSHKREAFSADSRLYTGDMDFGQFISTWVPKNADQIRPQISRFTASDGRLATNFLISYDKLQAGLDLVAKKIKVPELAKIPTDNVSPRIVGRADLTPDEIKWIETRLHKDAEAIARYSNKLVGFDVQQGRPAAVGRERRLKGQG